MKKLAFRLLAILIPVIIVFAVGEIFARIKGERPWTLYTDVQNIKMTPKTGLIIQQPELGFTNGPGVFRVKWNGAYSFTATIGKNHRRITRPTGSGTGAALKPEIWLFGCSITFGWGLNDNETFAWLAQEKLPGYKLENFGTVSYGTVDSLLQMRQEIRSGNKPAIAILMYGSLHDDRNTLARYHRKGLAPALPNYNGVMFPYARFDKNEKLKYMRSEVKFTEFPLMRYSALAHFLETTYDTWEGKQYNAHEVSKAVIIDFYKLCKKNHVVFAVAGITGDEGTKEMIEFCNKKGIPAVDISIDLNAKGYIIPRDRHPDARANEIYAVKLEGFINNGLAAQTGSGN